MKRLKTVLCAVCAVASVAVAVSSCSKTMEETKGNKFISISVTGAASEYSVEDNTKSGLVNNIRVRWAKDDKVYAFDNTQCLGELTVSLKDNSDYYAVLSSGEDGIKAPAGTKITLVHSNVFNENNKPAIDGGKITVDLSSQNGASSADDIPFVAYGTLDYNGSNISNAIVNFTAATSIIRMNCTGLEPSVAITGATLIGMSNQCALQIDANGSPSVVDGAIDTISISFTGGLKASDKGAQVIYAALAKNSVAKDQSVEVTQSKTYEYAFGSKDRKAAICVNAICQMTEKQPKVDYVTIGGLKWATCNLGAEKPTDYGKYFSWGDVKGQTPSGTTFSKSFDYTTAPFGMYFNVVDQNTACPGGVLAKTYDAANYALGGNWRMPTSQEFQKLCDACDDTSTLTLKAGGSTSTTEKGIYWCTNYNGTSTNGLLFCDGNNKLFFPATGRGIDYTLYNAGEYGNYWSSSHYSSGTLSAYSLVFNSSNAALQYDNNYRYYGYSVRPVSD